MIDDEMNSELNCCAVNVPATVTFCGNKKLAFENVVPVIVSNCIWVDDDTNPSGLLSKVAQLLAAPLT